MTRQIKVNTETTAKPGEEKVVDSFSENVEQALKHFHDSVWLGRHSPLASPYFLGTYWRNHKNNDDVQSRGVALQQLIHEATAALVAHHVKWGDLWSKLLHLAYFDTHDWSVQQMADKLVIAPPTFHRHQKAAIEQLAQAILALIRPTLRLETPALPPTLLGRDTALTTCVDWLRQGKSVSLTGAGGVGKTTLGVAVAHRFAPTATFWFTLQPSLNDNLHSILFALGYFLHGQGASGLWSQLVADRGEVKIPRSLNLLRHDLMTQSSRPLVLCFDEVDLLNPTEVQAHRQLAPFLDSLRGLASLLFIGQKQLLETDYQQQLVGLSLAEIASWLQQTQIPLAQVEIQQLLHYTGGNPRLLELFIAFYHTLARQAQPVSEALASLAEKPSVEFLLRRIWRHLNEDEMALLKVLAIFRNPVPRDAWLAPTQQAALAQLQAWRLVQSDQQGGVALLPTFKAALAQYLLAREEKEVLHLQAAAIRARYGQYTAAAHHYVQAEEPQLAVQLWYIHREQEINQGQAEAALQLLQAVSQRRLAPQDSETLALLRAELYKLLGHYDEAQVAVQATFWQIPFLKVQAKRLEGDIAELRGEVQRAIQAYQAGLETVEQWLSEAANYHRALGYLYNNEVEFERAQREVYRIRHEAANLEGAIHLMRGNIAAAHEVYEQALLLAQQANYAYGEANTHNNLGSTCGWRRQLAAAEAHLQTAIEFFQNTGRLNKQASATYNLAFARRLSRQFTAALAPAHEALTLFTHLGEEYGRAVTKAILAEIHLGLNELELAESYARQVIDEERTNTLPDGLRILGEVRLQQSRLTEADQLIRQSLAIAQQNQDRLLEGYAWRARGKVYLARSQAEEAQSCLTKASSLFLESGLPEEIAA